MIWKPEWSILDPLMAMAVAIHILFTGFDLLRRSADGLMDVSLPEQDVRDVTVRHHAHEEDMQHERDQREREGHERATATHDGLVSVALRGAVSIANRMASPRGPPVANVRVAASSKGAPKRWAVA